MKKLLLLVLTLVLVLGCTLSLAENEQIAPENEEWTVIAETARPRTGDATNIALLGGLLILSGFGIVLLARKRTLPTV